MAQSTSTRSRRPELSTMERGHQTDGLLLCAGLCASLEISPESDSVQTLQRSLDKAMNSVFIRMQKGHIRTLKDPVVHLRVRWIMETSK